MIGIERQFCAVCKPPGNFAKKVSIPGGGARCSDFTGGVAIKTKVEEDAKGVFEK